MNYIFNIDDEDFNQFSNEELNPLVGQTPHCGVCQIKLELLPK